MTKLRALLLIAACAAPLALFGVSKVVAQCPGINCTFNQAIAIPVDGIRPTYGATTVGLVPASGASDIATICGSATRLVRVTQITFSGRATTAVQGPIVLVRRSAANTGGTSQSLTRVVYDTGNPSVTVQPLSYTANATLGTALGSISSRQYFFANLTTTAGNQPIIWRFGDRPASAIVLRGTAQCLSVSLNFTTYSGGLIDVGFEWTEE